MGDTVHPNHDYVYRDQATKWLVEVIGVSIVAGVLNFALFIAFPSILFALLSLILILAFAMVNAILLFRHIDTLILKRLAAIQEEKNV